MKLNVDDSIKDNSAPCVLLCACQAHTYTSFSDPKSAHFAVSPRQIVAKEEEGGKKAKNQFLKTHKYRDTVRESIICFLPFSDYPFTRVCLLTVSEKRRHGRRDLLITKNGC